MLLPATTATSRRLDSGNAIALYYGIIDDLMHRLQSIQNAAVRALGASHQFYASCTGFQVEFKVATLVHQTLFWHVPSYLAEDFCLVINARPRNLRPADTRTLLVSRTHTNLGKRAFSAVGPRV